MVSPPLADCDLAIVVPVMLAVTEEEMPRAQVPLRIRPLFDNMYAWLKEAPVRQAGHNYVLYDRCTPRTMRVRVGFPVTARFDETERVKCVQLAPGRAAHAVHFGPPGELQRTYAALHAWCSERAVRLTDHSWEVYGDPTPDPAKTRTDIFMRVVD